MPKSGILVGALCGALVTAALIASLFFAYALAGLPFVPFQLFDRAARTLPGAVIRFGIDTMVSVIRDLQIGETSSVAKTAEQTMAVAGCLLVGTLAGALLFAIRQPHAGRWPSPGIALGLLLGVPAAWVAATAEEPSSAGPVLDGAWVLLAFVVWASRSRGFRTCRSPEPRDIRFARPSSAIRAQHDVLFGRWRNG